MAKGDQKGWASSPGDCAGRSIIEMYEDMLDGIVMWLQTADKVNTPVVELENMRGRAQGVAECLAILAHPYYPNVDAVKHAAVVRYRNRIETDDKATLERLREAASA